VQKNNQKLKSLVLS